MAALGPAARVGCGRCERYFDAHGGHIHDVPGIYDYAGEATCLGCLDDSLDEVASRGLVEATARAAQWAHAQRHITMRRAMSLIDVAVREEEKKAP